MQNQMRQDASTLNLPIEGPARNNNKIFITTADRGEYNMYTYVLAIL